jgi:hypothetical protein
MIYFNPYFQIAGLVIMLSFSLPLCAIATSEPCHDVIYVSTVANACRSAFDAGHDDDVVRYCGTARRELAGCVLWAKSDLAMSTMMAANANASAMYGMGLKHTGHVADGKREIREALNIAGAIIDSVKSHRIADPNRTIVPTMQRLKMTYKDEL